MSESLTPDQIARLDPYNRLGFTTKKQAEDLLGSLPQSEPVLVDEVIPMAEMLVEHEKVEWKKVLGSDIRVSPPPDFITLDFHNKMRDAFGLSVFYMPDVFWGNGLNITTLNTHSHAKYFLEEIEAKYPNWRPAEKLTPKELAVEGNYRNLNVEFWQNVKKGKINFPNLPGKWMVAETRSAKPNQRPTDQYPLNIFLGINDRDHINYFDTERLLDTKTTNLSNALGFASQIPFRLPSALEANLMMNRFGYHETHVTGVGYVYLTSTKVKESFGREKYLQIGAETESGWAANTYSQSPEKRDYRNRFRLVAELE